jgi:hypothetical protein
MWSGRRVFPNSSAISLSSRAGRLRLIAGPYADASRERLVHALGLPRGRPPAETEAAIDWLQARQDRAGPRYSELAARLRAAHRSGDVVRHAAALQRVEKDLIA